MINKKEKLKDMDKEIDKALEKYWCSECLHFHKKFFRGKLSITFFKHLQFKTNISEAKLFRIKINKSFKKYSIDSHTKTTGSKLQ